MRICHIVEAAGGGSGQVVIDLVQSTIDSGNEVTLIHSPNRADSNFTAALKKLEGKVRIYATPMKREVGMHDLLDGWRLYLLLRRTGPYDIIHSHSSKAGALARLAGILMPRAVQVYTPHAFMTMAPNASPLYGWIEWILSWMGSAIICVSPQEERHATSRLKIPKRKLHVIVNGIHLDYPATRAQARAGMGFGEKDFVVGFVGRMVPQKNPRRLASVFAIAARLRPDICLAVVGDGPLRAETEQILAYHGLSQRVRFLGSHVGRDLVPGFDCLLCTSDYESFGLVILEAMAAGVPVISTPVGIAEEAIIDGETGFVSDGFSSDALAAAVASLAALDPASRALMSNEARTQAKNFSLKGMVEKTMTLYADLVAQRRA